MQEPQVSTKDAFKDLGDEFSDLGEGISEYTESMKGTKTNFNKQGSKPNQKLLDSFCQYLAKFPIEKTSIATLTRFLCLSGLTIDALALALSYHLQANPETAQNNRKSQKK